MFPFEVIQLQLALSLAVTHGDDLEMAWTPHLQCVEGGSRVVRHFLWLGRDLPGSHSSPVCLMTGEALW